MSGALNPGGEQRFIGEISRGRATITKEIGVGKGSLAGHLFITVTAQTTSMEKCGIVFRKFIALFTSKINSENISLKRGSFKLTEARLSGASQGVDQDIYNIIRQILSNPDSDISEAPLSALSLREGLSDDIRSSIFSHSNFNLTEEIIDRHANDVDALIGLIKSPNITSEQKAHIYKLISELDSVNIQKALELAASDTSGLGSNQIGRLLVVLAKNSNLAPKQLVKILELISADGKGFSADALIGLIKSPNITSEQKAQIGKLISELDSVNIQKALELSTSDMSGLDNGQIGWLLEALAKNSDLAPKQLDKIFKFTTDRGAVSFKFQLGWILKALAENPKLIPDQIDKIFKFITDEGSGISSAMLGLISVALAKSPKLTVDQHKKILEIIEGNVKVLDSGSIGWALVALAKSPKLTVDQYHKILELSANPELKLEEFQKNSISEALDRNRQLSRNVNVFKELHQLNIITNPSSHLNRIHHFISDRIMLLNDPHEKLLEKLDGMNSASRMSFLQGF